MTTPPTTFTIAHSKGPLDAAFQASTATNKDDVHKAIEGAFDEYNTLHGNKTKNQKLTISDTQLTEIVDTLCKITLDPDIPKDRQNSLYAALYFALAINKSNANQQEKDNALKNILNEAVAGLNSTSDSTKINAIKTCFNTVVTSAAPNVNKHHFINSHGPLLKALQDANASQEITEAINSHYGNFTSDREISRIDAGLEDAKLKEVAAAVIAASGSAAKITNPDQKKQFYAAVAASTFYQKAEGVNGGDSGKQQAQNNIKARLTNGISDPDKSNLEKILNETISKNVPATPKRADLPFLDGYLHDIKEVLQARLKNDKKLEKDTNFHNPTEAEIDAMLAKIKTTYEDKIGAAPNVSIRQVNAAAVALVDSIVKDKYDLSKTTDVEDIALTAVAGIALKDKGLEKADEIFKKLLPELSQNATEDEKKSRAKLETNIKKIAGSHEKATGMTQAAVSIGALVGLWLGIKKLFSSREVENEDGEKVKKGPSLLTKILVGIGIAGAVTLGVKVGIQKQSLADIGEQVSNTWQKYVTDRGKQTSTLQLR